MYEFMQMNRNLGQSNKLRYKIFTTYQNDDLRLYILSRGIKLHKQLVFYAQQNLISLCIKYHLGHLFITTVVIFILLFI